MMKAKALRYSVRLDRHGRDGRLLRAATGRMADGRDRQLHHAFRVVHTYLPGGIGGFLSMYRAVAGRNSDYGRGQHFALDRLMLTDNDCLPRAYLRAPFNKIAPRARPPFGGRVAKKCSEQFVCLWRILFNRGLSAVPNAAESVNRVPSLAVGMRSSDHRVTYWGDFE
jgi:hypothetical protein